MFENLVPHIFEDGYRPAQAVDIFVRDLGVVTSQAESGNFPAPMAETAHRLFQATSDAGFGGDDAASVVKLYAEKTGIKLPELQR